jgi:xanthine dehydrogenase accessory factor
MRAPAQMNKQLQIWELISSSLQQQTPVALLYVLESSGSSPGRQGFFMAVTGHGEMEGSIGGGIMEYRFVEMAKKQITREDNTTIKEQHSSVRKQIHTKSSARNSSGMICSGEQTILLYIVKPEDIISVQHLIASLVQNNNGTLILSPIGIQFDHSVPGKDFAFVMHSEDNWLYKEKTGYKNSLTIIGGGHCSLAFSRLMSQLDFYIRVYDERKELKTMLENNTAHEKYLLSDYRELSHRITSGSNHYVLIMTFGYRTDDIALRALFNKAFRYLGLLGSKRKIEKMFVNYRNEGFDELQLQRIHTPVGIPIRSQTPEEIAISIAAEIIREKNSV